LFIRHKLCKAAFRSEHLRIGCQLNGCCLFSIPIEHCHCSSGRIIGKATAFDRIGLHLALLGLLESFFQSIGCLGCCLGLRLGRFTLGLFLRCLCHHHACLWFRFWVSPLPPVVGLTCSSSCCSVTVLS